MNPGKVKPKMKTVSSLEMRRIEKITIEHYGIAGIVLVENAGRAVAESVEALFRKRKLGGKTIGIICGYGNNGGDGFVAARYLYNKGYKVSVICLKRSRIKSSDALSNLNIVKKLHIPIFNFNKNTAFKNYDVIIDALLGTGVKGTISGQFYEAIDKINASRKPVVSADVPSGIDSDTGEALGIAVKADITVTMGFVKTGLVKPKAKPYPGKLVVADIGIPINL
jgi:ADP-dependent NAD(P)H-hydrate dehydratase / NAD(P)H-hydrate epimerase